MTTKEALELLQEKYPDKHYWNTEKHLTKSSPYKNPTTEYKLAVQPGFDSACDIASGATFEEAFLNAERKWKAQPEDTNQE